MDFIILFGVKNGVDRENNGVGGVKLGVKKVCLQD